MYNIQNIVNCETAPGTRWWSTFKGLATFSCWQISHFEHFDPQSPISKLTYTVSWKFAYFGKSLPYVCSSLARQTEKWHKKNINSADRKHSTNLPRVTIMMVRTTTMMLTMILMMLTIETAMVAMMVNVGPDADLFPCVSGLFLQMEY